MYTNLTQINVTITVATKKERIKCYVCNIFVTKVKNSLTRRSDIKCMLKYNDNTVWYTLSIDFMYILYIRL